MIRRIVSVVLIFTLAFSQIGLGFIQGTVTAPLQAPILLGITFGQTHGSVPTGIQFNLNIPKGTILSLDQRKDLQTNINYFLTALTIQDSEFWVNLNPNQPNRLTGTNLSYTDMGKHLLLLDLKLKKDTAFSLFPGLSTGATTYWERVFAKAKQLSNRRTDELKNSRTVSIPTTFRVWIVPDKAEVYEDGKGSCVITKSTLKVLLESEYLQLPQTPSLPKRGIKGEFDNNQELQSYCEAQLKELILPNLTYKVNHDPSYEPLRQIYNAIILAKWYKENVSAKGGPASGGKSQSEKLEELTNQRTDELKNAFSSIINTNNLNGLISKEPVTKEQIFAAYLDSVKQGEYHLTKTNYNEELKANIRRSYVSGGVGFDPKNFPGVTANGSMRLGTYIQDAGINVRVDLGQERLERDLGRVLASGSYKGAAERFLKTGEMYMAVSDEVHYPIILIAGVPQTSNAILQDLDLSKGLAYSEQKRRHLAYTLLDFDRRIRASRGGSYEQRLILEAGLNYVGQETALLSRGVLDSLNVPSADYLKLVFEYLTSVIIESVTTDNLKQDLFTYLCEHLPIESVSETRIADSGTSAQRVSYFIGQLGWNLRYIANRPIFVTNAELSTPGLAVVTEAITDERRSELQLQAAGILSEDYVVEVIAPTTALAVPEAQASENEEKPQKLGIARRVMDMFSLRNRAWPVTNLPLAQRLRTLLQEATCLTNSQRQEAFSQTALLMSTNRDREQAVKMLINLTRQLDIQPAVLELLTYLDTETATLVFMKSFARTSDDVVSLITWLSFLDSARARLCLAQYKGMLTEEVLANLPLSCYVLAHMMETRRYKPYIAAIRTHMKTEDKIAGLATVARLIVLVDTIRQQGTITRGQTQTISFQKSIDDIEAIQTELSRSYNKLQELKQQASAAAIARTTDSDSPQQIYARELRRVSDICMLGRLPADVVKALAGFAKDKGIVAFDLLVELITVQEPQAIAIFVNTLGQNQPRLAVAGYDLSDKIRCVEFLSLLLARINQPKAVGTLDVMVHNQQLYDQDSRRLAERILLGPAVEALDQARELHEALIKTRPQEYNTELEFQLTGVLLAADLTKGQREQAVKRCAQIIETTDDNWHKLKADFRVLIALRTDLDQARKDAIAELGRLKAIDVMLEYLELIESKNTMRKVLQIIRLHKQETTKYSAEISTSLRQIAEHHPKNFTEEQCKRLWRLSRAKDDIEDILVILAQRGNAYVVNDLIAYAEAAISTDEARKLMDKHLLQLLKRSFNPEIEQWATWRRNLINILSHTNLDFTRVNAPHLLNLMIDTGRLITLLSNLGMPEDVARQVSFLNPDDETDRKSIIRNLGESRHPLIVEPLITCLRDENEDIRHAAAQALAKIGQPAVDPLIVCLRDEDKNVRQAAVKAFIKIGRPAVERLIACLRYDNNLLSQSAIKALGEIGDPRAVEPLIKCLKDEDGSVRYNAREALIKTGRPAVESLIECLKDPTVRDSAIESLIKIGKVALPALETAFNRGSREVRNDIERIIRDINNARTKTPTGEISRGYSEEELARKREAIKANSSQVAQDNREVVVLAHRRIQALLDNRGAEIEALLINAGMSQQDAQGLLNRLRGPPLKTGEAFGLPEAETCPFNWFNAEVESPNRYFLGAESALAINLIQYLSEREGVNGLPNDLIDEYILHELLENTDLDHYQIIRLTQQFFNRGKEGRDWHVTPGAPDQADTCARKGYKTIY
ncbi:MAG: HEAT repeat domain-containing protein [Candidatus Omnitrophota bacterium]